MGHVRPLKGCYRPCPNNKVFEGRTARDISEDEDFILACEEVGAKPSIRQARDYRRKLGRFSKLKG